MNKLKTKHLEAIVDETYPSSDGHRVEGKKEAATSCAEITKEYAIKFKEWAISSYELDTPLTTSELWDEFEKHLNEKA